MIEDLTFEQLCALDYGRNMVVTSGPGAGKTRILSHRFCFILLTDDTVSVSQILTLTFTEKASEEMKGRIYEMLSRLDRDLSAKGNVGHGLRKKVREAKEQFHKNKISTIHSFCANLLREHPVESGVDPGFVVIQGTRKENVMERAVEAGVLSVLQEKGEDLSAILQSFGGPTRFFGVVRKLIDHPLVFSRVLKSKERLSRTKGWQKEFFREYCRVIKEEYLYPYLKGLKRLEKGKVDPAVLTLLEEWRGTLGQYPDEVGVSSLFEKLRKLAGNRKVGTSRLAIREGLREISYIDLVETFYPDLFGQSSPDDIFESQLETFLRVAEVCLHYYQNEKEKMNTLDFSDLETLCHSFLTGLFQGEDPYGLKRVQNRFKYIMVDEFQDTNRIQWEIIRLLCSDKGPHGKPVLQPGRLFVVGDKRQAIYRFRGGDVTAFQYATEEVRESNRGTTKKMFWEFPQINGPMEKVENKYPEMAKDQRETFDALPASEREKILGGDIYFPHNFRTDLYPIEFLNKTFQQIFSNKGAADLKPYETAPMPIRMPDHKGSQSEKKGSVTLYVTHGASSRKDQAEREASLTVDIVEGLLGKNGEETFEYRAFPDIREKIEQKQLAIGILFFAFTHLRTFEAILREAGLPFKVHKGKGFFQSPEVMEMVQLLNYLSDERQHISLLAALRSPIFALTDSEIFDLFHGKGPALFQFLCSENPHVRAVGRQIESWRLLSTRLTISELIRTIIADRSLRAIYSVHPNGTQRLANMEKLIDMARLFQAEGNGSLLHFVQYCLDMAGQQDEEGEAPLTSEGEGPICLMTIHAAKGLEFPMVIIPDLDRRPPLKLDPGQPGRLSFPKPDSARDWDRREGQIPVWQVEIPGLDFRKGYGPLGYLLARENRLEDMAENRRVFYVGCTRTEHHLILMGHIQNWCAGEERVPLSTQDYREKATIIDLLDDIHQLRQNFSPEDSHLHESQEGLPTIIYRDPEPRRFRGIIYGERQLGREDLGEYDDRVRALDLTGPLRSWPYYQFSFQSIRLYRRCPLAFYYGVILGLKMNSGAVSSPMAEGMLMSTGEPEEEREWEYGSKEALFVGSIIHRYLERHRFGHPFDENLFLAVCERMSQADPFIGRLNHGTLVRLREKACKYLKTTVYDEPLIQMLEGETRHAEVPFLFTVSQGCEFRGTIDRLFRDKRRGHWVIIDWKSSELTDKDPLEVVQENDYHIQLSCYKWAVEHLLKEKVGLLYVYFTNGGRLIETAWEGHPAEIIHDMVSEIHDYERNRSRWVRDLRSMRGDMKGCRYCEYGSMLCQDTGHSL